MDMYAIEKRRAERQAARDARDAESDRRADESVARERVVLHADPMTDLLPGRVGAAVSALFEALRPTRMEDGHLSHPVVGRSSDEIVALASAIVECGWADIPQRWVVGPNGSPADVPSRTETDR